MRTITAKRQGIGITVASVSVVVIALTLSFLWFLGSAGQAYACKCVVPGSPAEEIEKFDAVFAGKVFLVRHSYDPDAASVTPEDRTTVGINVSTVWKGAVHEVMYITTPPTGGSCGFAFAEGEDYVIYASDSAYGDDSYTAGICSRTALLSEAQADLDALGAGEAPEAGTKGPVPEEPQGTANAAWTVVLVLAAGTIVVVGVAFFVGMRRR